jgi:hypothetical protein
MTFYSLASLLLAFLLRRIFSGRWKATPSEKRLLSPTEELGALISGVFLACCGMQPPAEKEQESDYDVVKAKDDPYPQQAFADVTGRSNYSFDVETSATSRTVSTNSLDANTEARKWTSESDDSDRYYGRGTKANSAAYSSVNSEPSYSSVAITTTTIPAPSADTSLLGQTAALVWAPVTLAASMMPVGSFQGEQRPPQRAPRDATRNPEL